jgi:hypothetical protein
MPGFDWAGLASLVNTAYGMYKGNQDPQFFTKPPTDAEQWALQARKDQYSNNAARNYVGEYTNQFMQGLGNLNPNFQVQNSRSGNSAFMGGIQLPRFDASRLNAAGAQTTRPAGATTTPTGPTGLKPDGPSAQQPNGYPPGAGGNSPFYNIPQDSGATNYTWDDAKRIAQQYGPDAVNLLGTPGALAMGAVNFVRWLKGKFGGGQQGQNPTGTGDLSTPEFGASFGPSTGANRGLPGQDQWQRSYQEWLQRQHDEQWERDYGKLSGAQGVSANLSGQDERGWGRRGRIKAI